MAWARALHEPKDTGDTEAHPSVTQPPSNRRWPADLQGSFSDHPSLWQGREGPEPIVQREKQFPHKMLPANQQGN